MRHAVKLIVMIIMFFVVAGGCGAGVMYLWNWVMPAIFGMHVITYWQAFGLLALSWLLFGGPRLLPRDRGHWRHRMRERWEQMTPEEREKFRAGMRHGCGPFKKEETKSTES
jgi:hypothetical protein